MELSKTRLNVFNGEIVFKKVAEAHNLPFAATAI
jgi:hypothetical protein